MINLRTYQEKAKDDLLNHFFTIVEAQQTTLLEKRRCRMVFEAPTGAGKTVVMASFLQQVVQEMPLHLNIPNRQFAFIWLAPNQLHEQSQIALKEYFESTRALTCKSFQDLTDKWIEENDVLFLNWESIWSKKNNIVKESENGWNLYEIIESTKKRGYEVVVIVDEAHRNLNGDQCQNVLQQIDAAIEIEVSATPKYQSSYSVRIPRIHVIQAGMIKKSVVLNPQITAVSDTELKEILLVESLKKRKSLEKLYAKQWSKVRPLLLIQLPNDKKEEESALDKSIHEQVVASLAAKGITTQNGKLAIWLSKIKENQEDQKIKPFDSTVEVLLFKQAIALGWDCPRAAVLLIFRELNDNSFAIQTVGRILRMAEQKHYADDTLNHGYVYTDLSKDVINIADDAKDYISLESANRQSTYQNLNITKEHLKLWGGRNVLGYRFREALKNAALQDGWVDPIQNGTNGISHNLQLLVNKLINTHVSDIQIQIPLNTIIDQSQFSGGLVQVKNRTGFAKTTGELMKLFEKYCADNCKPYEAHRSAGKIKMALIELMEDYLGTTEFDTYKLVLHPDNEHYWNQLIEEAKKIFEGWVVAASQRKRLLDELPWEVPEIRSYFSSQYKRQVAPRHILQDYYQDIQSSQPEKRFIEYLEKMGSCIRWWYKNGNSGIEYFSVSYTSSTNELRLFYPDFIVLFGDGTMGFFDTKTKKSDEDAPHKHNALIEYLKKLRSITKKEYFGGVIIEDPEGSNVWKLSRYNIENTSSLEGWDILKIADYKGDWVEPVKEPSQAIHIKQSQEQQTALFDSNNQQSVSSTYYRISITESRYDSFNVLSALGKMDDKSIYVLWSKGLVRCQKLRNCTWGNWHDANSPQEFIVKEFIESLLQSATATESQLENSSKNGFITEHSYTTITVESASDKDFTNNVVEILDFGTQARGSQSGLFANIMELT